MESEKVTAFIAIYKGFVEEVKVFRNNSDAKDYYKKKVLESYESVEQYEEEVQYGTKLEFKLVQADLQ